MIKLTFGLKVWAWYCRFCLSAKKRERTCLPYMVKPLLEYLITDRSLVSRTECKLQVFSFPTSLVCEFSTLSFLAKRL